MALPQASGLSPDIATVAKELFETLEIRNRGVLLLGISLSNLNVKELQPVQLELVSVCADVDLELLVNQRLERSPDS
ncbi:DinB/UmuC family translesion DNA polymerase [Tolypothrix sp. NIES-4075]|uniref:DinB/UmuC family translesion DNA polymerase n=1 Tax=Tolypothrix sp. NIES-4075 TaxID=2005459 RepID=UPI00190EC04B|nr:hypothetical protein [Tolypothrix sp. NIES-4075]